ncbi:MAG: type II toxin-antitoxin system RelB/DinJ family antitoxin [Gammaproteobacteria bacterium]
MATTNDIVKARIDHDVKVKASEALQAMGLSVSDAIRLLMLKIAEEKALPFPVGVPNKTTLGAMRELEQGKGKSFDDVNRLMADLNEDD